MYLLSIYLSTHLSSCWVQLCAEHHHEEGELEAAGGHRGTLHPHQVQSHQVYRWIDK